MPILENWRILDHGAPRITLTTARLSIAAIMSIKRLFLTLALSLPLSAVQAADLLLSSKEPGPDPIYPIGVVKEPFARAVGRLFEVNGTASYFSG